MAYSYAARDILKLARDAGAITVLGQIDGGFADEMLIDSLWVKRGLSMPDKAPNLYWQAWREECQIADRIVVNSEWSRQLLIEAGIKNEKINVVPVMYEQADNDRSIPRKYTKNFNAGRPLKVLFLGALTLRKGVLETLEAARDLACEPVHFMFVGSDGEGHADLMKRERNVTCYGPVPRSQVLQFYKDADVFLFPTHSDGFGITQIEALASGLPVVASRNCALVVDHGRTGLVLEEVSVHTIVRAIREFLENPRMLSEMSEAALVAGAVFRDQSSSSFLTFCRNLQHESVGR